MWIPSSVTPAGMSANIPRPGEAHDNQPVAEHCVDPCEHPGSTNPGRHVRRGNGRRLHHHDGGPDAGIADRFPSQLVDTMPHITVNDERRSVPSQPAEQEYAAVAMSNVANVNPRPGIRYPDAVMASLKSWLPGDVAPSARTTAIIDHGGGRIGVTLTGIDPRFEVHVSKLASQMREGQLSDLSKAANGIIIGLALAEKLAVKTGNTVVLAGGEGTQISATVVGIFRSGLK